MPITDHQCVLRRWRCGWRSWVCSDPFLGHGLATTIPIPNRYSAPLNTGLTIQTGHSAAKKKPANGLSHLLIGTTTSTAIAASNSLRPSKGIAVRLLRSAASVPTVYELARIANPNHWSRSIRCLKQPDLVWINPPADDLVAQTAKLALAA